MCEKEKICHENCSHCEDFLKLEEENSELKNEVKRLRDSIESYKFNMLGWQNSNYDLSAKLEEEKRKNVQANIQIKKDLEDLQYCKYILEGLNEANKDLLQKNVELDNKIITFKACYEALVKEREKDGNSK